MKQHAAQFAKARDYLMTHGRELERRLFAFHFEKGSKEPVLEILRLHQNPDGGFQAMGEGDREASSPIGTSVAFQILTELGVTADEEMVQKGIRYLLDSYDATRQYWVPDTSRRDIPPEEFEARWGNPSAELVGYLHAYKELVPPTWLAEVTERALQNLLAQDDPMDMFAMLCFLRMANHVESPLQKAIHERLRRGVRHVIETDACNWLHYCAKPFWYAPSPDSPLYEEIADDVTRSLAFELQQQAEQPEGNFPLNWPTSGEDERWWKSIWTLETMVALERHGMW